MMSILENLFSSTARVKILSLFLRHPQDQFYQREIERVTGQAIRAVQREVKRLQEIDLLVRSEEGNRVFYSLNPAFGLLDELTALFQKAASAEWRAEDTAEAVPPEPASIEQPFGWIETLPAPPLPTALRRKQVEGEWDQAY
jgi:DNA-binding transcriptional ArsR family regulator